MRDEDFKLIWRLAKWNSFALTKVNILTWGSLDTLPIRVDLLKRGMDLQSLFWLKSTVKIIHANYVMLVIFKLSKINFRNFTNINAILTNSSKW